MTNFRHLQAAAAFAASFTILLPGPATGGDAQFYEVLKGSLYTQTSGSVPLAPSASSWSLMAFAQKYSPVGLTNATLQSPEGVTSPLPTNYMGFLLATNFTSSATLDEAFPYGTYTLTMGCAGDGTQAATLAVVSNLVPVPFLTNWAAAQAVNADGDFTLQWAPFTNGTQADWIQVTVRDGQGTVWFQTPEPLTPGQTGLLTGTNTSVVIPGETLTAGVIYTGQLLFAKIAANTTNYAGVAGIGGVSKTTAFALQTVDVLTYGVLKGREYTQGSAATPSPAGYYIDAWADSLIGAAGITRASFKIPGDSAYTQMPAVDGFEYTDGPYTEANLNAYYPNGTYEMAVGTVDNGTNDASFVVTGNGYPAAPEITPGVFSSLVTFNAGTDFNLVWLPLAGATIADYAQAEIDDAVTGQTYWQTPEEGEAGALNGLDTSVVVPAYYVNTGASSVLYLTVEHFPGGLDFTAYPGATGVGGYYAQTVSRAVSLDIYGYYVMKGQIFWQGSPEPPTLLSYDFDALVDVDPTATNLAAATFLPPTGPAYPLSGSAGWEWYAMVTNKTTFDAQFPAGTYYLTNTGVHDGTRVVGLPLPPDNYPAAVPQIANFAAAQQINGGADFTLAWRPINAGSNLFMYVEVDEWASGQDVFNTPWVGVAGALYSTNNSVVIPGGTLRAGYSYLVTVMDAALATDTASYPGALGLYGYNNQTQFKITVPGTPFPKRLEVTRLGGGQVQLNVLGEPGRTNVLESSPSLASPVWLPLATNIGSFTHSDSISLGPKFYRFQDASAYGP